MAVKFSAIFNHFFRNTPFNQSNKPYTPFMKPAFLLTLVVIASCSGIEPPKAVDRTRFKLPYIIQKASADTLKPYKAEGMVSIFPPLIGKFKFGDTVNMLKVGQQELSAEDYRWESQYMFDNDSFSSDGLQIIPDYKTLVAYSIYGGPGCPFFPVYVVNETYEPKLVLGKDNHGFAIQEALDRSEYAQWHPIESKSSDFCGNGRFRKKLNPNEFMMFLLPKYAGSDTTLLRIRFKIGESIFISKAFRGLINPKQFDINSKNWFYEELKKSKGCAASYLFYGGQPKGNWD